MSLVLRQGRPNCYWGGTENLSKFSADQNIGGIVNLIEECENKAV